MQRCSTSLWGARGAPGRTLRLLLLVALLASLVGGSAFASTVRAVAAGGLPGATVQVPILFDLVSGENNVNKVQVYATVTPDSGAAALTSNLGLYNPPYGSLSPQTGYTTAPTLAVSTTSFTFIWSGSTSQFWPAVFGPVTGVEACRILVPLPASAVPGTTYDVNLQVYNVAAKTGTTVSWAGHGPQPASGSTPGPDVKVTVLPHTLSVTASASPATVASGGSTDLTGSATDSYGDGIATWAWDDGGAGGTFSDATAQNPSYTAPANTTDGDATITLTLTATCNNASPVTNTGSCTLTVNPVAYTFSVTPGAPSPSTVASGGTTSLSAIATDSRTGHTVTWSWSDGGAGGSFSDATAQDPSYTAPANTTDSDQTVTLSVTGISSGGSSDTETTTLTVQPVAHTFSVTMGSPSPSTVASGGTTILSASATDSRTGHTVTWVWNDGGAGGSFSPSATAQSPSYTAAANTTDSDQTVTLSVTGICSGGLSDTKTASLTVQPVTHTLVVGASATPSIVASGGTTSLSGTATDSRGHGVASWSWDDGGAGGSFSPSASAQNPSYTAPVNGTDTTQTITLTVSATCDGPSPLTQSGATTLSVQPAAHTVTVGATATPTAVASGGSTTLSATATDAQGHGIATWSWTDGGAGGTFSPSAGAQDPDYTAPANTTDNDMTITLTVMATCNGADPVSGSQSASLTVHPAAHTFSVTANPPSPDTVASGGTTSLSATATDSHTGHTVTWSWNDGGAGGSFSPSATSQNPSYTAAVNNTDSDRTVTLSVTGLSSGADARSDTKSTTLTVQPASHPLTVNATATPSTVASRGTTALSATASDTVATWSWEDGGAGGSFSPSASVQNPSYTAPANHSGSDITVTLTVTATGSGATPPTAQHAVSLTVTSTSLPKADFSASPLSGRVPLGVAFTDASTNAPTSWSWDFGDGTGATDQNPSHSYTKGGPYTVALTTSNAGGSDTATKSDYIKAATFSDVAVDNWAWANIEACVGAGIVQGYADGTYQPGSVVTRDQMAVYVARALAGGDSGVPTAPATAHFSDVPTDFWAFKYVEYAYVQNIVSGYADGTYGPGINVDRGQMAAFVARSIVTPLGEAGLASYTPPATPSFPDVPTDFWTFKHIEYLKAHSIVSGYGDGDYHPEYDVTRDQMAVYISRAFSLTP